MRPAAVENALSVRELTRAVKERLDSDVLLQNVWVRGEISNFTHHRSGHMYFTLKDPYSRIKAVMFAAHNRKLMFVPEEGTAVLANGNVSVFERDGQYQFYVADMQPDGTGSLYMAFEQLKNKLQAAGWFADERKRRIPFLPRAIGVITSASGAAVRDILITLKRRAPSVPVQLLPVQVQGKQAASEIARAIEVMNARNEVDVLIVGRGGGSLEELWAFNEEIVARSIFHSSIPVISAVGHETDFTIADFVADLRAATPTAAAELAVPHHRELKQRLAVLKQRLAGAAGRHIERRRERWAQLRRAAVFQHPQRITMERAQRLDRLKEQLVYRLKARIGKDQEKRIRLDRKLAAFHPGAQVRMARRRQQDAAKQLVKSILLRQNELKARLHVNMRQLDALSPLKVMARGYSLVYDEAEESLIKSVRQVQPGDPVVVRVADGKLHCQVWSMKGEEQDDGES